MDANDLIGTWRLVSYQAHMPDGTVRDPMGANPAGRLTYDRQPALDRSPGGRMAVQFRRRDRAAFASGELRGGTPDEMKAAFFGYMAYFGTYAVDEAASMVTHHVEGSLFPNWEGQEQIRFFGLEGNCLTLTTPPMLVAWQPVTLVLGWNRDEG
jgi:hypothetical protein